jgi:predicted transcriptional regulator
MEQGMTELLVKVKAIAQGPAGKLFTRIVDSFFAELETEYFSEADLAEIEEGFQEIKRGEYITLEELKKECDREPLSPECLQALNEVEAACKRGDSSQFISWEDFKKNHDL